MVTNSLRACSARPGGCPPCPGQPSPHPEPSRIAPFFAETGRSVTARLQILSELARDRRAPTGHLANVLQRSEAEARHLLTRMVERGWVEARGEGKGRTWHLSAAVYRVVETPAGYVRTRGFEPFQQEQLVLQYVDAHGRITRALAADLCAIASDQASRLLLRLAARGELVKHGERRWTTYTRPAS